jgi:hypothetical protein
MTQKVRNFLPFSPAKEGPLSDLDKVGPGLVDTIGRGIDRTKNKVTDSVSKMWQGTNIMPKFNLGLGFGPDPGAQEDTTAQKTEIENRNVNQKRTNINKNDSSIRTIIETLIGKIEIYVGPDDDEEKIKRLAREQITDAVIEAASAAGLTD